MRLLLVCDEGHSTSILMARVQEALRRRAREGSQCALEVLCDGYTGGLWDETSADVILTAPQVAFLQRDFETKATRPIALGTIPRRVFGALDGDAIIDEAIELYDAYEELRRVWEVCEELKPREVLVCCAGGMSSSLLVWFMEKAACEAHLHVKVYATGVSRGKFLLGNADCVLIAPQVSYAEPIIQDFNDRHVPVGHIPRLRYGRMDGAWIMKMAVSLLEEGGTPPYTMDEVFRDRWETAVSALKDVRTHTREKRDAIVRSYARRKKPYRE